VARHCGKVLICHEDSRTGGIGESLAAILQEECFEDLDAPVRIVGALDAPVPLLPSPRDAFLAGEDRVLRAARARGVLTDARPVSLKKRAPSVTRAPHL
jgi:pyruvate/2-oxoglutarate/acetoin dehydrogenase E1 component